MPLARRYSPEHSPQDGAYYGMDFSAILPPGVGIQFPGQDPAQQGAGGFWIPTPRLEIWTNTVTPVPAPEDWTVDPTLAPPAADMDFGPHPGNPWWWLYDTARPVSVGSGQSGNPNWWQTATTPGGGTVVYMQLGVATNGRSVYANVRGGKSGGDYQFRWFITDTQGNRWTRTGLVLCAPTS